MTERTGPTPQLLFQKDGHYLSKAECLVELIDHRKKLGLQVALTDEDLQLSVEECHALLKSEMKDYFVRVVQDLERTQVRPSPKLAQIALWSCAGLLSLSAPILLELRIAPAWSEWLLKGQDGEGRSWVFVGLLFLVIASVLYLQRRADLLGTRSAQRLSNAVSGSVIAIMVLGAIAFVAVFAAIMFGLIVPWLGSILPPSFLPYLRALDREPGTLWLAGAFALAICAAIALTYLRARRNSPSGDRASLFGEAVWTAFGPIASIAFVAMSALASAAMLLLFLPIMLRSGIASDWEPYLHANSGVLIAMAVGASVLAIPALLLFRRSTQKQSFLTPTFAEAALSIVYVVGSFALAILTIVLVIVIGGSLN